MLCARILYRHGVRFHPTVVRRSQPPGRAAGGQYHPPHPKLGPDDVHKALKTDEDIVVAMSLFRCTGQQQGYELSNNYAQIMKRLKEGNKSHDMCEVVQEMTPAGFFSTTIYKCTKRAKYSAEGFEVCLLIRQRGKKGWSNNKRAKNSARIHEVTKVAQSTGDTGVTRQATNMGVKFRKPRMDTKPVLEDTTRARATQRNHINKFSVVGKMDKAVRQSEGRPITCITSVPVPYNTFRRDNCKGGQLEKTSRVLREMESNGRSYKNLIHELTKARDAAGVLELFEAMKRQGLQPDMGTYLTVCEALGRAGRMQEASKVHQEMKTLLMETFLGNSVETHESKLSWTTAFRIRREENSGINAVTLRKGVAK